MIKRLVLCVGCIMTLILGKLEVNAMTKDSKQLSEYFNNGAPITTQVGAYNTYVGARYVPIFCGEWDANNTYEPLSIVTNEGNSYTSRGYVPKGIPITNGTYWALTGNFNGQLASLQEDVDANTSNITSHTESISVLQNQVKDINSSINDTVILLGDSFGEGGREWGTGWVSLINGRIRKPYEASAIGGAAFSRPSPMNYKDVLNNISAQTKSKATLIYIQTAGNDTGQNMSQLITSMNNFASYAKSQCPNLKQIILIVTVPHPNRYQIKRNLMLSTQQNNISPYYSVIPESVSLLHTYNLIGPDQLHPNQSGFNMLAYYIAQIVNGECYVNPRFSSIVHNNNGSVRTAFSGMNVIGHIIGNTSNYPEITTANAYEIYTFKSSDAINLLPVNESVQLGTGNLYNNNKTYPVNLMLTNTGININSFSTIPEGPYYINASFIINNFFD